MSLRRYVLRRVLVAVPTLVGVSALTFALVTLLPGDVVDYVLRFQDASPALRARLAARYRVGEPLPLRYLGWLWDVVHLDFGESLLTERSVTATLGARLPDTLLLGAASLLVAVAVGIPAGVVAALRRGTPLDEASRIAALLGVATPNFWLGLLLLLVFGVHLDLARTIPPIAPLLSLPTLAFVVLPAITLGTAAAAILMRLTRAAVLDNLDREHVRFARAKGLSERTVVRKHVLRNALSPLVTVAAIQFAFVVDGAVVVEQVFSWPGVGRLLVRAIGARDVAVVQAVVLLLAVALVAANLFADLLYARLDPRVRYDR